jgi:hypothetical protein
VFVPHIIRKLHMELDRIGCLDIRISIQPPLPLNTGSHHPGRMEDMFPNQKRICCWSHRGIDVGHLHGS